MLRSALPLSLLAALTTAAYCADPVISVSVNKDKVHVEADYVVHGKTLALFNVFGAENLPEGQAAFIKNLKIADSKGRAVQAQPTPDGDWNLNVADQAIHVSYDVLPKHNDYRWPAGAEEVAYRTDEGLFFTGYALFIVPADKMDENITVKFVLPESWQAFTPWQEKNENEFQVTNRRQLLKNAMFFGTSHHDSVTIGEFKIDLVLGQQYAKQADTFTTILRQMAQQGRDMFGGMPRQNRYLIIVNEGPNDGGAFEGSFSQMIKGPATPEGQVVWSVTMAHELMHFWNGLSVIPATLNEEWFQEGFTDYVTTVGMYRSGLLDEAAFLRRFEAMQTRYAIGRMYQRSNASLQQAGHDKQPLRTLVYGGGAIAAIALEAQMREATKGQKGISDLMQSMFKEYGRGEGKYTTDDIIRHIKMISGVDGRDFFKRFVIGSEYLHMETYLQQLGLHMESFVEETFITRDRNASNDAKRNYKAAFGH